MYTKEAEFRAWLFDVKKISPDSLNTKQYFAEYMEDYNTSSLPSGKYYDIDKWDAEQRALKSWREDDGRGVDGGGDGEETFDIRRDEEMVRLQSKSRSALTSKSSIPQMTYSTDQMAELKRVSDERLAAEKLRKMGYKPKDSMGVRYEKF